jgi:hypothetical protein
MQTILPPYDNVKTINFSNVKISAHGNELNSTLMDRGQTAHGRANSGTRRFYSAKCALGRNVSVRGVGNYRCSSGDNPRVNCLLRFQDVRLPRCSI